MKPFFTAVMLLLSIPGLAVAATLDVTVIDYTTDSVRIAVTAETDQKHPFNAAAGVVSFPPEMLRVTDISLDNSIFNLWADEPSVSDTGEIRFSGGMSRPGGFIFKGVLFEASLATLAFGTAAINISEGAVLAHDGEGTDLLEHVSPASLQFEPAVPASYDRNENGTVDLEELSIGMAMETL